MSVLSCMSKHRESHTASIMEAILLIIPLFNFLLSDIFREYI